MLSTLPTSLVHLPYPATRMAVTALNWVNRRHVLEVHGLERLKALPDPFIVVINHSSYAEALLLPRFTHRPQGRANHPVHGRLEFPARAHSGYRF